MAAIVFKGKIFNHEFDNNDLRLSGLRGTFDVVFFDARRHLEADGRKHMDDRMRAGDVQDYLYDYVNNTNNLQEYIAVYYPLSQTIPHE